ncbi:SBDS protein C-terminal domain-containing protein [Melampsora americana]|nr:SBDS protein C-terminal domain-containing protein [Melampsora americana]
MPVFQPSNQIKLTNVSIVRLKKGGKRFEIACYKNKRQGNGEQELKPIYQKYFQTDTIFSNVSKGQVASAADLKHSFGSGTNNDAIVLEILQKGELQVSDKERGQELDVKKKEIAHLVAEKCLDPSTHRPHTLSMIEKAMEAVHFSVNFSKSSKIQALELIKTLSARPDIISLERAQMRVRLTMPAQDGKKLKSQIVPLSTKVALIDPGQFRVINEILQQESLGGRGKLETLSFLAEVVEGDEQL